MEYCTEDILKEFGELGNKAQNIRNIIPVAMERGDARHVCLSGIQTSLEPIILAYSALECCNQCTRDIELATLCRIKGRSNKEILHNFDTWIKMSLLVSVHFRVESFFANLLITLDGTYSKTKFNIIVSDLFEKITISDKDKKKDCFKVMSILRNSLHNNSINKNGDFTTIIRGQKFEFINYKPTTGTIFDHIFLIDFTLDIIKEIIESPEISKYTTPIPDLFHIELDQMII
jgi:hypothetical protein